MEGYVSSPKGAVFVDSQPHVIVLFSLFFDRFILSTYLGASKRHPNVINHLQPIQVCNLIISQIIVASALRPQVPNKHE